MSIRQKALITAGVLVVAAIAVAISTLGEDYPDAGEVKAAIREVAPAATFADGPSVSGGEIVVATVPTHAGTTRVAIGVARDRDAATGGFNGRVEQALGPGWGNFGACANWIVGTEMATETGDHRADFDVEDALRSVTPKSQTCAA